MKKKNNNSGKIHRSFILTLLILLAIPTLAHRSPVGCAGSSLSINLFTDLAQVRIGDVISLSLDIFNGTGPGPIVCDASDIRAFVVTPDGRSHSITLLRTTLTNGQVDSYPNVVTYTARAEDVQADGSLKVTANDVGTIHQNDTNSIGGGNQSLNITILSTPKVVPVVVVAPVAVVPVVVVPVVVAPAVVAPVVVDVPVPLPPPPATASSGGNYWSPLPLINITKTPSPVALPDGPGLVTYTYAVTNIGVVRMNGIWVKDDKCSTVEYISGNTNKDNYLDLDEVWIYRCAKTVSKTETNIATTHGSANGWDAFDTANATVVVAVSTVPPMINIVKVPNRLTPLPFGGGEVTYTYTVSNIGTVAINNVVVSDNKCSPVEYISGDLNTNTFLEINEKWIYTCRTNLTKTTTNIGKVVGHANGLTVIDFSPAIVAVRTPSFPNAGLFSGK